MILWTENEAVFLKKPYLLKQRVSVKLRIQIIAWSILIFAAIEHILAKSSQFQANDREATYCNYTINNRIKFYAIRDFRHNFTILPYSPWLAIGFWVRNEKII